MDIQPYAIRQGKSGDAVLECRRCDYRVRTKDFNPRNGNVRTQAASAMIAHQTSEHRRPPLDGVLRFPGTERMWSR